MGETIYLNDFPFTVIGVMAKKKQDSSYDGWDVNKVFVPFSAMRRDFPDKPPGTNTTFDQLLVTPKSVDQHEACKREVRVALARMHHYDPNDKEACPIWDTVKEAQAFKTMTDGMKFFLGAVGIVTLLLGGIGVMNVMLVAVRERTREIGVRKAIGAPSGTILRQFFIEALIIALLSGADRPRSRLWILRPGQPAAHAGLFRRPGPQLEFWADRSRFAGSDCGRRRPVSGAPRGIDRSD